MPENESDIRFANDDDGYEEPREDLISPINQGTELENLMFDVEIKNIVNRINICT